MLLTRFRSFLTTTSLLPGASGAVRAALLLLSAMGVGEDGGLTTGLSAALIDSLTVRYLPTLTDEIEYITDCVFRKVPKARCEEDEMSGEVWYTVGPKDVFPETFDPFLLGNPAVRDVFMHHHADLLDAAFWQKNKDSILQGQLFDVFPYEQSKRFKPSTQAQGVPESI